MYNGILLLLLLSCFSHVQLCVTPWTAAYQASPSMGFSRQEHWSGCNFLLQCMKVESESEVAQSCLTLSYPMDCSLPGSSIHGIFQRTVLEWGAIAFSHWDITQSLKKRNTFESVLIRWINLEPITQSEVSQKVKDKYHILTHIYGI